ncbi:hypothetical protein GCM10025858_37010 [Alicyclobacillus sacchari]|uniref:hypothetical protein n=1 Tax=Alicyclobacillus sacchari TaxID=392010 RepID=UPI0023E9A4C6|nr:hypothetical protein [Alicyclobacillus sacchari]GMA59198.1 hypothetical protein GCM10025858_37010 [Alicyclobacillus sacchari]
MEFAYVHENVAAIRLSIEAACAKAGRDPADVRVIAVTKTAPPDIVLNTGCCLRQGCG